MSRLTSAISRIVLLGHPLEVGTRLGVKHKIVVEVEQFSEALLQVLLDRHLVRQDSVKRTLQPIIVGRLGIQAEAPVLWGTKGWSFRLATGKPNDVLRPRTFSEVARFLPHAALEVTLPTVMVSEGGSLRWSARARRSHAMT